LSPAAFTGFTMGDGPLVKPAFLLTLLDTVGVTEFRLTDVKLFVLAEEGTSVLEDKPATPTFRTAGVTLVVTRPRVADSVEACRGFARRDAAEAELRSTGSPVVMQLGRTADIGVRTTV
jgi:hypothetical protein